MNALATLLGGASDEGKDTAQVLDVPGAALREHVKKYLDSIDRALPTYAAARETKLGGRDWEQVMEEIPLRRQIAQLAHDSIGPGPHRMSFTQLFGFLRNFGVYITAEEAEVAAAKRKKARDKEEAETPFGRNLFG